MIVKELWIFIFFHIIRNCYNVPRANLDNRSPKGDRTVIAKNSTEKEVAKCGVRIKYFHVDNGVFKSAEFRLELKENGQNVTFCGIGTHHQSSIAES